MTALRHPSRFAPSRYRYALCRLAAYLLATRALPHAQPTDDLALTFTREQSALENNGLAVTFYLLPMALLIAWLEPISSGRAWLVIPAIAAPAVFWSVAVVGFGLVISGLQAAGLLGRLSTSRVCCFFHQALLATMCGAAVLGGNVAMRAIGAAWLAVLAVNAICWIVLLLLRRQVLEVDEALERCVA